MVSCKHKIRAFKCSYYFAYSSPMNKTTRQDVGLTMEHLIITLL